MSKRRYPPEIREQAIMLAAGQSASTAAQELNLPERSVQRWVAAEPTAVTAYIAHKTRIGAQIGAERYESVTRRVWDALEHEPLESAKQIQALATAYGILTDKLRLNAGLDAANTQAIPAAFKVVREL